MGAMSQKEQGDHGPEEIEALAVRAGGGRVFFLHTIWAKQR
jgi:hypothetical protein